MEIDLSKDELKFLLRELEHNDYADHFSDKSYLKRLNNNIMEKIKKVLKKA